MALLKRPVPPVGLDRSRNVFVVVVAAIDRIALVEGGRRGGAAGSGGGTDVATAVLFGTDESKIVRSSKGHHRSVLFFT